MCCTYCCCCSSRLGAACSRRPACVRAMSRGRGISSWRVSEHKQKNWKCKILCSCTVRKQFAVSLHKRQKRRENLDIARTCPTLHMAAAPLPGFPSGSAVAEGGAPPVASEIFRDATAAVTAARERMWRLQVQALTVAPMDLFDSPKSDAAIENLRRLHHPYLGCLLQGQPVFDDSSDHDGAFKTLGLSHPHHCQLFHPFPRLSPLERSLLQAEAFGERSRDSIASIPFIFSIPQEVLKLRYLPPSRKTIKLELESPPSPFRDYSLTEMRPVFAQKITLVKDKDKGSFFEIETNTYHFERTVVGSEKIMCQNVCITRCLASATLLVNFFESF